MASAATALSKTRRAALVLRGLLMITEYHGPVYSAQCAHKGCIWYSPVRHSREEAFFDHHSHTIREHGLEAP